MNKTEHLLTCLIEECSEVQKEATKALRFGLNDSWKGKNTPVENLVLELYDILGVINMLEKEGIIPHIYFDSEKVEEKRRRILHYMEYAITTGALQK